MRVRHTACNIFMLLQPITCLESFFFLYKRTHQISLSYQLHFRNNGNTFSWLEPWNLKFWHKTLLNFEFLCPSYIHTRKKIILPWFSVLYSTPFYINISLLVTRILFISNETIFLEWSSSSIWTSASEKLFIKFIFDKIDHYICINTF